MQEDYDRGPNVVTTAGCIVAVGFLLCVGFILCSMPTGVLAVTFIYMVGNIIKMFHGW